jgi:hypothetical protein
MAKLLADPRAELAAAATTFKVALRRFYRTRNIVLHGGTMRSVALHAALRTAAPLFGVGLDRMVHAALTHGEPPLMLAACAEESLRLVGGETAPSVAELLDPTVKPGSRV